MMRMMAQIPRLMIIMLMVRIELLLRYLYLRVLRNIQACGAHVSIQFLSIYFFTSSVQQIYTYMHVCARVYMYVYICKKSKFIITDGDNAGGEDNGDDNDQNDRERNDDDDDDDEEEDGGDGDDSGDDSEDYDPNVDIHDLSDDFSLSDIDDIEILFS